MNKLTAEKCREQFEAWASNNGAFPRAIEKRDGEYILLATQSQWTVWQASRAALEIALPILEQQERLSVKPVAFTGSGSLAAIKAGAEGVIWGSKADAHPIELFARYPASFCQKCNNTGSMDSGGTQPWGEAIMVECDCQFEQQEQGDGWIERGGGDCPVADHVKVEYQLRGGAKGSEPARRLDWQHEGKRHDIIAYRIIPEQIIEEDGSNK